MYWLFTEDYGKLYVFENQPTDFDSLYDVIDKKTVVDNRRSQHNLMRMFGVVTPIFLLMNVLVYLARVYIYTHPTELAVNVYAISEKMTILQIFDIHVYTFWNNTSIGQYGHFDRTRREDREHNRQA